jgi:hypothetical protein
MAALAALDVKRAARLTSKLGGKGIGGAPAKEAPAEQPAPAGGETGTTKPAGKA